MSDKLPENWMSVDLGDVVEIHDSERKPINSSERTQRISGKNEEELYPYYGATGQVGWIDEYLSEKESVLLGEDGAPFLNPIKDKAYIVKGKFWVNNHAHILRGSEGRVNNRFICYQLNILDYSDFVSGTTRLKLTKTALLKLPFILCSYNEQIRIVDKIEELLSDQDNGIAELKAAQTKLSQYRQSLLKSAIEGTLTQKWRGTHKPKENGAQLLERILIERRQRWEQKKLEEFKKKDKKPPKDWQKKYKEPVKPDAEDLPDLPEGWVWSTMDQLIQGIEAGKNFKCFERPPLKGEYGVVKVSAVTWGEYDELKSKTCIDSKYVNKHLLVSPGDFLFSRANTTELVGACVIAEKVTLDVMLSDKILRFIFVVSDLSFWILQFMRSGFGRTQIELSASGNQESMKNISQEKLRSFIVPLPSIDEIKVIGRNLSDVFEKISAQTKELEIQINQTVAQRKNILKSAFSGGVVEQDPNDEPASVLLERIKAERDERAKQAKSKRVKKKMARAKKINVESVTNWIHDNKKFSFDDLRMAFSGDYDELKDVLFAILGGEKPIIKQVFDKKTKSIIFVCEQA